MAFCFQGKRALVTGAGKGIGRDIAKALHKGKANVVAVSRSQADLDSLKAECPGLEAVAQDLSEWKKTKEAIGKLGHFDLLVNNAGVSRCGPFLDFMEEDLDYVFDTNFKSVFNVSQVVSHAMVDKGTGGSIVHISSTAAKAGLADHAAYCPTKAAVDSLMQVMAVELGPKKIRVNCVNPTVVMTKMGREAWSDPVKAGPLLSRIPLGKFVEIEDVTNAVLFLLSDQAAMVNGTTLVVDGGLLCN
ncbi:L-xylulose reductase-like [Littorina saxatilis]|uniref:Ketoreductase domain-containing protein n=1 Tax=Littorina saxatilis TaxID=31220 RepID=A0AAN9BSE7_9CAEN